MSTPQLSLKQATAATLDLLIERPELAVVFWMDPGYVPPKPPGWVRWLARTLGGYTPPMELPKAPQELDRSGDVLRVGEIDAAAPNDGLTPLLASGQPIPGSTHGYGDERALYPNDVATIKDRIDAEAAPDARLSRLKTFLRAAEANSLGFVVKLS